MQHDTMWMNLEDTVFSDRSQLQRQMLWDSTSTRFLEGHNRTDTKQGGGCWGVEGGRLGEFVRRQTDSVLRDENHLGDRGRRWLSITGNVLKSLNGSMANFMSYGFCHN